MNFEIVNEEGNLKLGNVITVFNISGNDRDFVLFSISDFDENSDSLHVAYLDKDKNGYDCITEIPDKKTYDLAMDVVSEMIKKVKTH